MIRISLIKSKFKDSIRKGSSIYIQKKDVEEFIAWCTKNHLGIIGIDGIEIKDGHIHTPLDVLADFSSLYEKMGSAYNPSVLNRHSLNFFKQVPEVQRENIVFDFTLTE